MFIIFNLFTKSSNLTKTPNPRKSVAKLTTGKLTRQKSSAAWLFPARLPATKLLQAKQSCGETLMRRDFPLLNHPRSNFRSSIFRREPICFRFNNSIIFFKNSSCQFKQSWFVSDLIIWYFLIGIYNNYNFIICRRENSPRENSPPAKFTAGKFVAWKIRREPNLT